MKIKRKEYYEGHYNIAQSNEEKRLFQMDVENERHFQEGVLLLHNSIYLFFININIKLILKRN